MNALWKDGSICPVCGESAIGHSRDPIEEHEGGRTYLITDVLRNVCRACGEEFFHAGQVDEIAHRAVAAARTDFGRLTSDEIREMRFSLGLTQAELEAQLGVSAGSVGRWERGDVLQGATADRLLRLLAAHPELLPELGYVAREGRGPYRTRPNE